MNKVSGETVVEIISYKEEYKEDIKRLNYEWLEKYFRVEKGDEISLSDPQKHIIDKGGYIFFARQNNEIVATAALLKKTDTIFELGKMAITSKVRGTGIGKILIEHCLAFAGQKNISTIILYSNTQLKPAIHLYRKYGFREIELENGLYERANIKMQLDL